MGGTKRIARDGTPEKDGSSTADNSPRNVLRAHIKVCSEPNKYGNELRLGFAQKAVLWVAATGSNVFHHRSTLDPSQGNAFRQEMAAPARIGEVQKKRACPRRGMPVMRRSVVPRRC